MKRFPAWLKQAIPDPRTLEALQRVQGEGVHTVCKEAHCPNAAECMTSRKLTFMILGDRCTRSCRFCAVEKRTPVSPAPDPEEPERIARVAGDLELDYAVITSVTRDDLPDGGAQQFVRVAEALRRRLPGITLEFLIPDFRGKERALCRVLAGRPDVLAHNLETVPRLYPQLKPDSHYAVSRSLLKLAQTISPGLFLKSSLLAGLGETEEELVQAMADLRSAGCRLLTLGQYLAPSAGHAPVKEFVTPGQFRRLRRIAQGLGFAGVLSGPLVRSSYQAERLYREVAYA